MYIGPAGLGKIRITMGTDLYEFKLPEPLYSIYMDLIVSIEADEIDTHTGDLARRNLHNRLIDWWIDKMPHMGVDIFSKALERTVEYDLPHYRRSKFV